MDIALVYQSIHWKCGPGSWTAHLYNGLKSLGYNPRLIKIGKKHDSFEANGMTCTVMPRDEVLDICGEIPSILCAIGLQEYREWVFDLIEVGCIFVLHSMHTNRYHKDFINSMAAKNTQIIAVRSAIHDHIISKGLKSDHVWLIPHMYITREPVDVLRTKNAVCTTRINSWKNVDIIMKANSILMNNGNRDRCVFLHGSYFKSYMLNHVVGKIPGWDDGVNFTGPMYPSCQQGFENGRGYDINARAGFAVDLTNFPKDNGDLQYCALEAIDAGAVYIGNTAYIDNEILIQNHNCLSASDSHELAEILMTSYNSYKDLIENAKELLEKHKPENVIHHYDDLFNCSMER